MRGYVKSFFIKLKECKKIIGEQRNKEAAKILLEVIRFTETEKYSSYKRANELATLYNAGYDSEYISAKLNIHKDTVRTHTREVSDCLYDLFGEDFLDCLSLYSKTENKLKVDAIMRNIETFGMNSSDIVSQDILVLVNEVGVSNDTKFDIKDCKAELSFLVRHCKMSMLQDAKSISKDKLNYILRVIDNTEGNPVDRSNIMKLLMGRGVDNGTN